MSAGIVLCNVHFITEFIQQLPIAAAWQISLVVVTLVPAQLSAQLL